MKRLIITLIVTLTLLVTLGCQEDKGFKTAQNVRIHEIPVFSQDSSSVLYWYIFHNGSRFIYTKSPSPLDDFSGTFFLSSKKIPKELKFTEEFILATSGPGGDTWGFDILELQEPLLDTSEIMIDSGLTQDTGAAQIDSVVKEESDVFMTGDSLGIRLKIDSMMASRTKNLPSILLDYEAIRK